MIGISADDITGAGDIGIMFAKAGYASHIYPFTAGGSAYPQVKDGDVVIFDTNSRFDSPKTAYDKVFAATAKLRELGCTQFINKTCSVFRGNIGAEFDAMLDALGESFAVVVLGFPKNGRTTVDGIHYVHGKKLEESEFRHDPVHPMTRSDLAGILRGQTERTVAQLDHTVVEQGPDALRQAIEEMKNRCHYLILDVTDQQALRIIAEAVLEERVLCGSSALSEELALLRKATSPSEAAPPAIPAGSDAGLLITAGSLMPQTARQVEELRTCGTSVFELDTLKLLDPEGREPLLASLTEQIAALNLSGRHVLVHSSHDAEQVRQTKSAGSQMGLSNTDVSRLVSGSLAEITARVLAATGQTRAIIAGGDTSASACERLGVQGMRIVREIEPGLPSCLTFGERPLLLVLKSGSFGKPDFFQKAIRHLMNLSHE
ncbi:four-carbon acid sugar kinase family protein [Cohnella pontilimi]|uniref:Four-carbon acid sugar kinase family protein n=1 Tax=Cohnella pontilimi TaxID=2564100 RepID=A0A4V6WEI5_9BACL|nr:four-carbon acid sugar kinase family protein [Cohnella pontilimi]TJY43559.1 four-carbon acid sugar kinase family protein [Cohnella pontilimi]